MPGTWYIFPAVELLALLVGTYYLKSIKHKFLYLYIFVLLGVLTDVWNILSIKLGTQNNLWVSHIYFPLEFILLALFYRPYLAPVIKRKWITLIIVVFMLYAIFNAVFIQSIKEYSNLRMFTSIVLVVFSLMYFYRLMNELRTTKLSAEPMVWINTSVLISYSAIFFYNILFNLLLEYSREATLFIASINGYVVALFYLVIAIAFWKAAKQWKALHS